MQGHHLVPTNEIELSINLGENESKLDEIKTLESIPQANPVDGGKIIESKYGSNQGYEAHAPDNAPVVFTYRNLTVATKKSKPEEEKILIDSLNGKYYY